MIFVVMSAFDAEMCSAFVKNPKHGHVSNLYSNQKSPILYKTKQKASMAIRLACTLLFLQKTHIIATPSPTVAATSKRLRKEIWNTGSWEFNILSRPPLLINFAIAVSINKTQQV
jgi:hypothetical protein